VSTLVSATGTALPAGLEIHGGGPRGGDRLLRDYLAGEPALGTFYSGHPGDPDAFRRKAAEVERRLDAATRARVAPAIQPMGDAAGRLRRILDGDGFFVTTGQQPALFGGPLYTLYKTLGAIRLADQLEHSLGRPVLALFWIGADDHDWDEANHTAVVDGQGLLRTVAVRGAVDAAPLPLSERRWGRGIAAALDEFAAALPDSIHADAVRAHLRSAYTAEATVAASFTETFRLLLADQRIAFVSSADPALRRAAAPVFLAEAERTAEHGALIARQTLRLQEAGYPAQVAVADDASNLMLVDEHGRDRLVRGRRGWVTRRSGRHFAHDELLARIEAAPGQFSPNVLLRPIVENAVFPTIAYVAGPGELRYFAQLGCLFRAHGILPPVVVPRPGATLIEVKVRRALDRLGLTEDDLRRPLHELATEQARAAMPAPTAAALRELRDAIGAAYEGLIAAAEPIDASLGDPLRSARNASLLRAAEAEKRIVRAIRRRDRLRLELLGRAAASLYPGGAPQERVLGPLPFLAAYGPALIPQLAAAMDVRLPGAGSWSGTGCEP
jgi:bacillithiol synthase